MFGSRSGSCPFGAFLAPNANVRTWSPLRRSRLLLSLTPVVRRIHGGAGTAARDKDIIVLVLFRKVAFVKEQAVWVRNRGNEVKRFVMGLLFVVRRKIDIREKWRRFFWILAGMYFWQLELNIKQSIVLTTRTTTLNQIRHDDARF